MRTVITSFVNTYIKPNVNIVEDLGFKTAATIDYDGTYFPISKEKTPDTNGYWFVLANGSLVKVALGDKCVEYDDNDNCTAREYRNIGFTVDVNGFNRPNVNGKDVFIMDLELQNNIFTMHRFDNTERDQVFRTCKTDDGSQICGYLIMIDGWEIKEDYPWL